MNLLRGVVVLFVLGFTGWMRPAAAAPPGDSPEVVTRKLYHSAIAHMGFTPETIKANRPWLTPDLYAHLMKKVNQPVPKGDAPDIEGDLFLDAQDVPIQWEVGKASIDGVTAKVDVTLTWSATDKRRYTVLLMQMNGTWRVCDVHYGKDGNLTDLLK